MEGDLKRMATEKKELTKAPASKYDGRIVGEMRLVLTDDEMLHVEIATLGRLTPGRLERAQNFILTSLMRARAAEEQGRKLSDFHVSVSASS